MDCGSGGGRILSNTIKIICARAACLFAVCLLVLIAAGHGGARAAQAGDVIEGAAEIGGLKVPLPDGPWTVFYSDDKAEGKIPVFRLGLLRTSGKAIKQVAFIRVAQNSIKGGFKPFEQCTLANYFFSETVVNQIGGPQNCWHVRPETLAADTPSERQTALTNYAKSKSLFLPLTMIGSRYHMANRSRALRVSYGWAPDLIMPAPKEKKAWRFQDWTADAVAADPRKKAIMTKMKRWGEEWRPRVVDAFTGKTDG